MQKCKCYLTKEDIIRNNQDIEGPCFRSKNDNNLSNENSLDYLVEDVKNDDHHKTFHQKAAFYAHRIIDGYIFCDGNKRTGMSFAMSFLKKKEPMKETPFIATKL
ncbi:MAG: Fic family protein [Candidatus Eremiobacteraeota bacterium]|nr:Fic family protein [Candidatus Eremiobacteraeota bacterium]